MEMMSWIKNLEIPGNENRKLQIKRDGEKKRRGVGFSLGLVTLGVEMMQVRLGSRWG